MSKPLASILSRRIRAAFKDQENAFAISEALHITNDQILRIAQEQGADTNLAEDEKGRRALLLLEIHAAVSQVAESLAAASQVQPAPKPASKLSLSHLH